MTTAPDLLRSHRALLVFLAKMTAVYAVWFVAYDLWLLPDGRLDAWLSETVAAATAAALGAVSVDAAAAGRTVAAGGSAILIEDGCNGLGALSLFVGFVVAYPGTWFRRALFIPLGLAVLVATNVARCASLLLILSRKPDVFGAVHGFHALFVFYVVVFLLWMAWSHIGGRARPTLA